MISGEVAVRSWSNWPRTCHLFEASNSSRSPEPSGVCSAGSSDSSVDRVPAYPSSSGASSQSMTSSSVASSMPRDPTMDRRETQQVLWDPFGMSKTSKSCNIRINVEACRRMHAMIQKDIQSIKSRSLLLRDERLKEIRSISALCQSSHVMWYITWFCGRKSG